MKQLTSIIFVFFILAGCSNDKSSNVYNTVLQKDSSSTLTEQHIFNIISEFTNYPIDKQNQLLRNIYPTNKKLAESLIIYRNRLGQMVLQPDKLKQIMEKVFLHYVINTDGEPPNIDSTKTSQPSLVASNISEHP